MATERELNRGAGAYSSPGVDTAGSQPPFQSLSVNPVVTFASTNVAPPSSTYIAQDDRLRVGIVNAFAGVQVDVVLRILRADGKIIPMKFSFFPAANRVLATFELDLTEGYILGVTLATPSGGLQRGLCYAVLTLIRAAGAQGTQHQTLIADYVGPIYTSAFPGGRMVGAVEGQGAIRSITGTTPAPGAEISETVPSGARWKMKSFSFQLTTAVAVANRSVRMICGDGANNYFRSTSALVQVASLSVGYSALPGVTQQSDGSSTVLLTLPIDGVLQSGHQIKTNTLGLQAADAFSAVQYLVEEWDGTQ